MCTLTTNKGTSDYYIGANYTNQTFRLNAVKENKPFFNENNFRAYLGEAKFVPLTEYGVTVAKDSPQSRAAAHSAIRLSFSMMKGRVVSCPQEVSYFAIR